MQCPSTLFCLYRYTPLLGRYLFHWRICYHYRNHAFIYLCIFVYTMWCIVRIVWCIIMNSFSICMRYMYDIVVYSICMSIYYVMYYIFMPLYVYFCRKCKRVFFRCYCFFCWDTNGNAKNHSGHKIIIVIEKGRNGEGRDMVCIDMAWSWEDKYHVYPR